MWILFATLNPLAEGFRSVFIKKSSQSVDPLILAWGNYIIPILIFVPLIFFIDLKFNFQFFYAVAGSGIINLTAVILYMKAISEADISQVMPIMSFTPLFLLITSPIMVGEFPNELGLVGVLLVVAGSYLLNLSKKSAGLFAPFKALLKNKGTRYMLIVSFIWSLSANFDKLSIQASSIYQHIIFMNLFIFSGMTIILMTKRKFGKNEIGKNKWHILRISFFTAGAFFFHMNALALTLVAYVVALKRLSGVFSVFLGYFILNEPDLRERLLGAIVMFSGVILIVLS